MQSTLPIWMELYPLQTIVIGETNVFPQVALLGDGVAFGSGA